jgi:hypothetical protein
MQAATRKWLSLPPTLVWSRSSRSARATRSPVRTWFAASSREVIRNRLCQEGSGTESSLSLIMLCDQSWCLMMVMGWDPTTTGLDGRRTGGGDWMECVWCMSTGVVLFPKSLVQQLKNSLTDIGSFSEIRL